MNLDTSKIVDIEIEGINHKDAPNYVDAYISSAWVEMSTKAVQALNHPNISVNNGKCFRKLNEKELEWLNNQRDFVYQKIIDWIY